MALGTAGRHRSIVEENDADGLKEFVMPYAAHLECEMDILIAENTILLEKRVMISINCAGPTPSLSSIQPSLTASIELHQNIPDLFMIICF